MKTRKTYVAAKSNLTLTQSGLLAVLLQRQRRKVIELARRRAQRDEMDSAFSNARTWLLSHGRDAIAGRTFRRGIGATSLGFPESFHEASSHVSPNPYLHRASAPAPR